MEEDIYLDKLDRRGIKPTAIRLLVIKAMMQAERAVSLLDLETLLDTVDKSTISRTIALFLSHHLIHSIDDGSGSLKYAVCDNSCNCVVQDLPPDLFLGFCQRKRQLLQKSYGIRGLIHGKMILRLRRQIFIFPKNQ